MGVVPPDSFPDLRSRLSRTRTPERKARFVDESRKRSRSPRSRSRAFGRNYREEQQPKTHQVQSHRSVGDRAFGEDGVRLRGTQFGGLNWIPNNPELDPPSRQSFRCWDGEHMQFLCPKKGLIPDHFCYNCGRKWRRIDNCERCRDAFARYKEQTKGRLNQPNTVSATITSGSLQQAATVAVNARPQVVGPTGNESAQPPTLSIPAITRSGALDLSPAPRQPANPLVQVPTYQAPSQQQLNTVPRAVVATPELVAQIMSQALAPGVPQEVREVLFQYVRNLAEQGGTHPK